LGLILGDMNAGPSDEEVVSRCVSGDSDAFAIIVQRYQSRFLRMAAGALADRVAAQDVVQDMFIKAYTRLRQYQPHGAFSAWLYTVFSSVLKDHLRRRKRYGGFLERLTEHYHTERPLEQPEPQRDTSWIRPMLTRLSEMQRSCILLRDIEQLNSAEVAKRLGINEATVRVHLLRGRRKLREIYEREIKKD